MKTKLIFCLFILTAFTQIQSQEIWRKFYNSGTNQDSAVALTINPSGFLFVTGYSNPGANSDVITIRYNPAPPGDTIWVRKLGGTANLNDLPTAITSDAGFVYVTGWIFNPGRDMFVVKYNVLTGDSVWTRTYNGTANAGDYSFAIAVDPSGNVYITGRSDVGGAQRITTIKYNSAGAQQWVSTYMPGGSGVFDEGHAIKVDASGNVFVAGSSRSTASAGSEDFVTIKYNSSGVQQWVKRYNGNLNGEDNAIALVLDPSGNPYSAGYTNRLGANFDFVVIKYNGASALGDSMAGAFYNGTGNGTDVTKAMTIDGASNIYLTGYSQGTSNADYATVKYNSNLVQQWAVRYASTSGSSYPSSIAVNNSSGEVYVTGTSAGSGTATDYLTVRYSFSGTELANQRVNGTGVVNDYSNSIGIDGSGFVYVTGSTGNGGSSGTDFLTIKYDPILNGIHSISEIIPSSFGLGQNYPNPFNPSTKFLIDIPKKGFVKLDLFNVLGQLQSSLLNQELEPGKYEYKLDASNLPAGTYFYKITGDNFTATKKMILIK